MKNQPLQDVKHIGCRCCNSIGRTLSKDKWLEVGFGSVTFIIKYPNGRNFFQQYIGGLYESEDKMIQVKDLEKLYRDKFEDADCITLFFNTPLHDETYEYNKDDGEWYLIAQGMGFA